MADGGPAPPELRRRRFLVLRPEGTAGDVSWMELFIDLFFVFAFLRVTSLMASQLHWLGVVEGILVVLMLWHCWNSCAWLGNVVYPDKGLMPIVVFGIATTLLIMGVAIPGTFTAESGGVIEPLIVATGYLTIIYAVMVVLSILHWSQGPAGRRPVIASWATYLPAGLILACAVWLPPRLDLPIDDRYVRTAMFALVVVINFSALRVVSSGNAQVVSSRHLAERHGLVVLVALGETVISVGISQGLSGDRPITWQLLVGAALSIAVVAVLWWTYFDVAKVVAEHAMQGLPRSDQSRIARDAYSGLHLPMICGLIVLALSLKHVVASATGTTDHPWRAASTVLLFGGVMVYLAGLIAFQRRAVGMLGRSPIVGIVFLLVLLPLAAHTPPLASLGLLLVGAAAMIVADRTVFRRRHLRLHERADQEAAKITGATPKELLVDLVFVFAFIQVTVLMVRENSVLGVLQGLILLALLWWAWASFCWVTHAIRRDTVPVRLAMIGVMAVTLVLGIALPQTFEQVPGGLPGASVVVTAYIAGRLVHAALIRHVAREQPELPAVLLEGALPSGLALALLAGSIVLDLAVPDDRPTDVTITAIWLVAVLIEIFGNYRTGVRSWRIRTVRHWTDRYALIMLIAFGETIIALGFSAAQEATSVLLVAVLTAAAVGICTIWWSYFHTDAGLAHDALEASQGEERAKLARDAYTYLHLPMVAGLILFAFGLRETLILHGSLVTARAHALGHYALFVGPVVYIVANQAFWWRVWRRVSGYRISGAVLVAVLAPVTAPLPVLWNIVLLAGFGVTFAVAEALANRRRSGSAHRPA
ncbi:MULTISPECIES: low temperature requirement protein A [unclassified Solwaraspora]|uniref:low temperature requirement protein A n=1 Tax=unclassified Solwaraspora TaxID=2627926 RepID=UPI00259B6A6B|nr:low temperature requirement protein A [Solwaraspora sp. WMMA2056]WJK39515.1 low temperature requirement protein A [Solwaraspora sp. WMMA2056]